MTILVFIAVPDPYVVLTRSYLADLRERLRHADSESREALVAEPLRDLVRGFAHLDGRSEIDLRGQAQEPGIGRPDFSIKDGATLIGHVETKSPGKGAEPTLFRHRHDKAQWTRFARLPNLLYTDGLEFALYHSGELARVGDRAARVRLTLDFDATTPISVDTADAAHLAGILAKTLSWTPIAPRSLLALADRLAPICATLRDAVVEALKDPASSVAHVTRDVRASLFPEASNEDLADAYAQTCTYSMLLARAEGARDLQTATIERALSAGHPVLARVVRVLLDPQAENEIAWAVELLRRQVEVVDLDGLTQSGQDTWLYFYEHFLAAYDPRLREERGVYYTPKEVISAQVTLAEEILKSRFNNPLGFAGDEVTVLDPAAGTGSYPLAVIEAAARSAANLGPGAVSAAVSSLAERLHAFELLVGPYSVAHLRLTEAIRGHGGTPPQDGVRVYLTDTLASPDVEPPVLGAVLDPLVAEQQRARKMKSATPVVVCLGNPPYDREAQEEDRPAPRKGGGRFGDPDQTRPILRDFLDPLSAAGLGEHAKNLYNDYVYFWRWAMWKTFERHPNDTARTGGIVTFISAASYLVGPAFAFMRKRLRDLCDDLYIIDLGGYALSTRPTENVFAIRTPVAIAIAVRDPGMGQRAGRVWYADWSAGAKESKLTRLASLKHLAEIDWRRGPTGPTDPFIPQSEGDYATWPLLGDLFPWRHSGVQLKRTWPVAPSPEALEARWRRLAESQDAATLREAFAGPRERLSVVPPPLLEGYARRSPLADLLSPEDDKRAAAREHGEIVRYEARSFDRQWVIRDERLGDRIRPVLWRILGPRQLFLCTLMTNPLSDGPGVTIATSSPPDMHYFRGSLGGADIMPLYRDASATRANVTEGLLEILRLNLRRDVSAEDLFAYTVGVMGTAAYTARFEAELGVVGPRLPITRDPALFAQLTEHGRRLIFLQSRGDRFARLGWSLPTTRAQITSSIPTSPEDCPRDAHYDAEERSLRIGSGEIAPIEPEVWGFSVSGYLVVQEWIGWRLGGRRPGHARSPLDKLRPLRWDFAVQRELLELIGIVEEILFTLTPSCAALLEAVAVGEVFLASDLPEPPEQQRAEPKLSRAPRRGGRRPASANPHQETLGTDS